MEQDNDKIFFENWQKKREKYKQSFRPFFNGLSTGICIGIAIICSINLGWYQRANMELNTSLNPFILILAITGIAIFLSYFNRNFQWEKNEARYKAILAKKANSEKPE